MENIVTSNFIDEFMAYAVKKLNNSYAENIREV